MSDDPDSCTNIKPSTVAIAINRQAERADALRANLLRRKAQARGRSEAHDDPRPKPSGDA
jgi:hypothetical protein